MSDMSRGEMIRRLDDTAKDISVLANGPLTPDEQHAIAETLRRLLPIVADSLQDQADLEAAQALLAATEDE